MSSFENSQSEFLDTNASTSPESNETAQSDPESAALNLVKIQERNAREYDESQRDKKEASEILATLPGWVPTTPGAAPVAPPTPTIISERGTTLPGWVPTTPGAPNIIPPTPAVRS